MNAPTLIVLAKAPVPGRVKTRLCPPCTPVQAARLAEAALTDTLRAVLATPAHRRVLALDGVPGRWLPDGFDLIAQAGGTLGHRLAGAFAAVGGPAVLIGMDTPQVTPALLRDAIARLAAPGTDAVLGPAPDGGYWAIGLRTADRAVFDGIPMSTAQTGAAQRARLAALGLVVVELPTLRDVDDIASALAAADEAPHTRFAAGVRELGHTVAQAA